MAGRGSVAADRRAGWHACVQTSGASSAWCWTSNPAARPGAVHVTQAMLAVVWVVLVAEANKEDVSKENIVVVFVVVAHYHGMSLPRVDSHYCQRVDWYWSVVRSKIHYPCLLCILNRSGSLTLHTMCTSPLSLYLKRTRQMLSFKENRSDNLARRATT